MSATVNTPSNYDDYIVGTYNNDTINGLNGNDRFIYNSSNGALYFDVVALRSGLVF